MKIIHEVIATIFIACGVIYYNNSFAHVLDEKIQLKPVLAGYPQEETTQIDIKPLTHSTTDKSCNTYYQLFNAEGKRLHEDNCPISEEEYALWNDNETLENIVLAKLNLERITI